eukprot:m.683308 g.683308  ORF g.683308 m.683308 type:complete len:88 (+) comp58604_c0_seq33:1335-1598(+)
MFPAITACLRPVAQFVVCVAYTLVGTIAVFSRRAGSFFFGLRENPAKLGVAHEQGITEDRAAGTLTFQQHGYKHMKAQIHGQQSIIW